MADTAQKTIKIREFPLDENPPSNYLNHEKGIMSWLFTLDHKRIGVLYLSSIALFFLVGGLLAIALRLELLTPAGSFMSADIYNRVFSLHGVVMVFLVIIPSIPASLGNLFLPMMVGAKDVAFPRLNLASWWIFTLGSLFALFSMAQGGVDTGWTFYTPYSTQTGTSVIAMTMGAFILGFSTILTAVNFIVTIHKMRSPGLRWRKLPLFLWSLYATSIIQLLATPVLAITLLLLIMERALGIGIFDPALGGDPVLYQHFFWFYSHPAVYIMIVPAFGVISELIATFSRKTIFGYWAIALSSLAIAFIGFLVWGHHMFVAGQSELSSVVFSFLTFFVGVPTGIKIFNWVSTMYRGSISLKTPMWYALSFLFLFIIGGVTGIMLGALSVNVHLHDTYYVVAHFHYVMMGGAITAFIGGLHYWWPKITGRMYNEFWAKIACLLYFIGFNMTFLPQFIMGSQGMPRRYFNYIEAFQPMHQYSTYGSWILGLAFVVMAIYLAHSLYRGKKAASNPWGARTLEWMTASPPIHHNFDYTPVVQHGPYDYHKPANEFRLGIVGSEEHPHEHDEKHEQAAEQEKEK